MPVRVVEPEPLLDEHVPAHRVAFAQKGRGATSAEAPLLSGAATLAAIAEEDGREAQAFVDRWQPRVDEVSNARYQGMLRVILGETLEHKRFFEQAAAGFEDLLGRRTGGVPRVGAVLPTRWLE